MIFLVMSRSGSRPLLLYLELTLFTTMVPLLDRDETWERRLLKMLRLNLTHFGIGELHQEQFRCLAVSVRLGCHHQLRSQPHLSKYRKISVNECENAAVRLLLLEPVR
jgi:hypothetical protein